ncbi:S8 family serine peptidase [Corynebacterium sp.]|uniref:S8 family serine peptidase n=1 Tax=Corynebacterium sp. TaxID=1720 RepID=UPI003B3BE678
MTGNRPRQVCGAAVLTCLLSAAVPVPAVVSQPRCDQPAFGDPLPVDLPLPHDLSTGHGVGVAVVDTGASAPGVVADRPGDGDRCQLHGTAVAGTLRSVAPASRIVSVRQGDGDRDTTVADLVSAIDRARSGADGHGVRIMNISVIACDDTAELRASVAAAEDAGLLLVAAAGNSGQCQDGQTPYPAALPGVLTVGGVDPRHGTDLDAGRRPADYSVPGDWVDLYAPGGPVSAPLDTPGPDGQPQVRTIIGDPSPFSGTSFAAPVVAGAAALVWQVRPELTAAQVRALLVSTAEPGVVPVVSPVAAVGAALDLGGAPEHERHAAADRVGYAIPTEVPVVRAVDVSRDLRVPLLLAVAVAVAVLTGVVVRAHR